MDFLEYLSKDLNVDKDSLLNVYYNKRKNLSKATQQKLLDFLFKNYLKITFDYDIDNLGEDELRDLQNEINNFLGFALSKLQKNM